MNDPIKARVHEGILPKLVEGLSPEVNLVETAQGVEMTVTTKSGSKTVLIPKGQDYYLTDADRSAIAEEAFDEFEEDAEALALQSEGWAEGTQDGEPVEEGSPYYEHNAKYWAGESADSADDAGDSASDAEAFASGQRGGVDVGSSDPAYHNNSKYYRDSAAAIAAGDVIDDDAGTGD